MTEARVGQAADLENVYRAHGDRLWRAVVAYTGDREVASDAVAEAFAQAVRRGDAIRDPASWVWKAAFRIAAGELGRRRRESGELREAATELPPDVSGLVSALGSLSRNQRGAVILHHYAGYPVKDVARILGSTAGAVRVHLHRGRTKLRTLLEDHHG